LTASAAVGSGCHSRVAGGKAKVDVDVAANKDTGKFVVVVRSSKNCTEAVSKSDPTKLNISKAIGTRLQTRIARYPIYRIPASNEFYNVVIECFRYYEDSNLIASRQQIQLSSAEYLQLDADSPIKHEYIDGYVYAMAGATDAHITIAGNLFSILRSQLRGSGCRVYISDMKARIESLNRFYYPDVMVTCDRRDQETPLYKKYPCLIVEVLSDSTEAFDRGDKFADYQQIESLQEYVVINCKKQRVECFRRNSDCLWLLQIYVPEHPLFQLKSINFETNLEVIYEDVTLEPSQVNTEIA
jgi:Uma2 family endonuclease